MKNTRNSFLQFFSTLFLHDIVITGSDSKGISSLKSFLHDQFHTKDLGMLKYFLGVEVMWSKYGIFLSQRKYVLDLLSETRKLGAKPCSSPMAPGVHLIREGETFKDPKGYKRLVGKLNYLIVTCPDISHSISVVSEYMSAPTVDHWVAVEQILFYLKGALDEVFYMVTISIKELSVSQLLIGQNQRKIRDPLQVTMSLLVET